MYVSVYLNAVMSFINPIMLCCVTQNIIKPSILCDDTLFVLTSLNCFNYAIKWKIKL